MNGCMMFFIVYTLDIGDTGSSKEKMSQMGLYNANHSLFTILKRVRDMEISTLEMASLRLFKRILAGIEFRLFYE